MTRVEGGDCVAVMRRLKEEGVLLDGCASDPPYHLTKITDRFGAADAAPARSEGATGVYKRISGGFMGQGWDGHDDDGRLVAFEPETWRAVYDILKPGAWLVAFGHTTRYHRLACAIEDAGFEIRDMLEWVYGSGMPHSHNVSKALDRRAGKAAERKKTKAPVTEDAKRAEGLGTGLKPCMEPICLARKPLEGSVAANWLEHGTGVLNIDACRIAGPMTGQWGSNNAGVDRDRTFNASPDDAGYRTEAHELGRWPAGLIHDGSPEVVGMFPAKAGAQSPVKGSEPSGVTKGLIFGKYAERLPGAFHGDQGGADRFFYSAKASPIDRVSRCKHCGTRAMGKLGKCCDQSEDASHPTVKPVDLMRWLLDLIIPPGGTVLDPFAGTGTTAIAAIGTGRTATLIERDPLHLDDIQFRLDRVSGLDTALFGRLRA